MTVDRLEDHDRLVRVGVGALVLIVAIATITPWPVGSFQDDAIYTILAKSLATGRGYRLLNLPGEPNGTHFPPGYPLFLAGIWKVWPSFPDNVVAFKFANAGCLATAALGAFAFVRRRLAWTVPWAAVAAVAGTTSIVVLLITGVVLSEPLFMAGLFGVLLLAESSVDTRGPRRAFASGVAAGALALVRTIGVAMLPAALLVFLWKRRPRDAAAFAVGALLLLLPWQLWVSAHAAEVPAVLNGKYGSYLPWLIAGYGDGGLPFLRDVVTSNVQGLAAMFGFAFMPVVAEPPRMAAIAAVSLFVAAGSAMLVMRAPITATFLWAYLSIAIVWPFDPARFLLAVWPLLIVCFLLPVLWLGRWQAAGGGQRAARWIGLASATVLALGFLAYNVRGVRNQWWASVQRDTGERAKPIVEWTARNTAPTDVLATDDDLVVYLYTQRRAVPTSTFLALERVRPLTDEEDIAAVRAILASFQPRFFITASRQGMRTAAALERTSPPQLRRYASLESALIFERVIDRR
ncbi:MAG: hypothetical protein MNPFHGCM_00857 [Gemmatimonadaceae bacterium]|nr:hypothetical protein [Gemmatimonadaceae bacterium]